MTNNETCAFCGNPLAAVIAHRAGIENGITHERARIIKLLIDNKFGDAAKLIEEANND